MKEVLDRDAQAVAELFIVDMVALRLRPLTMLFTVDCVTPLMLHSLLMEMFSSRQSSKMRSFTASPMSTGITSFQDDDTRLLLKRLTQMS